MKKILAILLTLTYFSVMSVFAAGDVSFVAKADNVVAVGQRFNLTFTLNNAESDNVQLPLESLSDFTILYGPQQSTSQSFQSINGQVTRNSATTYTYVLMPKKEGSYTISSAKATVGDKIIRSNALVIKVIKGEANANHNAQQAQSSRIGMKINDDDLFIRTELSKTKMYEQEQFIATTKVYYRVALRGFDDYKLPEYKGFISQEIEVPEAKRQSKENVNGKVYNTYILKQCVLIPQKSGNQELEKGNITAVVQVRVQGGGGGFFGDMFASYRELKKNLTIPGVKINVQELPKNGKPADFSGAVGSFTMNTSITPEDGYKTNDAITIKVKINGSGNLKYAKDPNITFPTDFELYDPKVTSKIKASDAGLNGTKEIEYLAIARYPGEYVIPSAEFSYFDIKSKTYKTLKTPEYKINVEKGAETADNQTVVSNFTNKESIKYLGTNDIRFINTKDLTTYPKDDYLFGSLAFYLWFIIPLVLFVIAYLFLRKLAEENSNMVLVRKKKANKQALKRLAKAKSFLDQEDLKSFYDETSKAITGFVGDKFNIPL
ncbi:MAG: protein BatD, partial [Paludibacteraceae bacterium]|nr:protein BatD [Paludibacteraceae bacterium]